MFGLFKKKSPKDKLLKEYKRLQQEAFQLSKVDRTKGDQKMAEADAILKKIEAIEKQEKE